MTNGEDELFGRYHNMEFTPGISIRAYLAAMAMQGLLANPDADFDAAELSSDAVIYAEELIAALNKNK